MQTVFISNIPTDKLGDIYAILESAPGFISSENLINKNTGEKTGVIFCRFKETNFETVKNFLEMQPNWIPSVTIQEGTKL